MTPANQLEAVSKWSSHPDPALQSLLLEAVHGFHPAGALRATQSIPDGLVRCSFTTGKLRFSQALRLVSGRES